MLVRVALLLLGLGLTHAAQMTATASRSALSATASRPALSHPSALHRLRGGEQPKTGKLWTISTFTRDHVRFLAELPHYLGAYLGPRALPPAMIEAVMVTVNSINTCPYCTGLHGQLARMAKSSDAEMKSPAVKFATTFALEGGRGAKVIAAFEALAASIGKGKALSVRALCWALLWGKTTGNTINAARGKLLNKPWTVNPFELLVFAVEGPLFLVIGLLNAVLVKAPPTPAWFGSWFGAVLWLPQMAHLLPIGILCLVLRLLAAPFVGLSL